MVLPASPPDAEPGAHSVAPWIERIAKLFRLVKHGMLVLVDHANDAQLGPLVRGLCREYPELWVLTEAARIQDVPHGAVVVLATRAEDAVWLNFTRPIFAERALKVVLWSKTATTEHLARRAPDFFNWIARRFECPSEPPAFAVLGFQAALRARAWAVDFRGRALDEVFTTAFPKRKLIRANAALPDDALLSTAKRAGRDWIAWTNILDERGVRRIRQIASGAGRRGRNILENPQGTAPEAWRVSDVVANLDEAMRSLQQAGLSAAGRLAAMLDLEPEAITLAAQELARGMAVADLEAAIRHAADPGAALAKRAEDSLAIDPVLVAAHRMPPPILRAFAADPRVRKARAILAGDAYGKLPPLTERISLDEAGADEFKRLMRQLLSIYAGQNRLWMPSAHQVAGVDAIMPDGLPDMPGLVAFWFYWPESHRSDVKNVLWRAAKDKRIAHWILVAPEDLTASDREWLHSQWASRKFTIYAWGQTWIEHLLRKCPPLLARYYSEEARAYLPGYDGTNFGTLATRYRQQINVVHNRLKTIGIPPEARPRDSRIELPLADLYIPLRLVPEKSNAEPLSLARVLTDSKNGIVLADPGMGKSTLLAYLALVFAGGVALEDFSAPARLVPMHISLRDFVRRQKQSPGLSFLDYLEIDARERLGVPGMHRAFFEATLRMGEAVVLLDGLDEVGNETARHTLAASIRAFQAEYSDCRFWVTSRIYGYTENVRLPDTFAHYRIARLDDTQINDFVGRWYTHQIGAQPQEAAEQAASLSAAIHRTPSVRRLAGNPLLLTLMAFIHHGLRRLPKDRGELYEKCIEMLLKTWEEAKRGDGDSLRGIEGLTLNVPTQKDYLAHLAFFIQQKNQAGKNEEARGLVSRREAIDALAQRHLTRARRERPSLTEIEAREEMAEFLEYVCDGTGLLQDRGNDQISFIHLSFQEYLAAWVFLCGTDLPRGPAFFLEHLGDAAWEEVLLLRLYIVLLGGGGGEAEFDQIIAAVLRSLERKSNPLGWLTLVRAIRDDLEFRATDRHEILRRAIEYWLENPWFLGAWYDALDEVRLFGERARDILRSVIAEMRIHALNPAEVIALLHLETKLFTLPDNSAESLRRRADLSEMLADLVCFAGKSPIRALLVEHAKFTDFSRALRVLDGPQAYRMIVRWMADPLSPAGVEAATAMLWDKVLTDFHSRAAFAKPRREHKDAILFDQAGAITVTSPFSSVTLPYNALRTLPFEVPTRSVSDVQSTLLCPTLASSLLLDEEAADARNELIAWTSSFIEAHFEGTPRERDVIYRLAAAFVRDYVIGLPYALLEGIVLQWVLHENDPFSVGNLEHRFRQIDIQPFFRVSLQPFIREFARTFAQDPNTHDWEVSLAQAVEGDDDPARLPTKPRWWYTPLEVVVNRDVPLNVTKIRAELRKHIALPLLLADTWRNAAIQMVCATSRYAAGTYPNDSIPHDALESWLLRNPLEVYATALAWEEHCKALKNPSGPTAALVIAHAAYATLMTGLECKLPFAPDLDDPLVQFSHILYELCNFRNAETNAKALHQAIAAPAPELRPLLAQLGLLT